MKKIVIGLIIIAILAIGIPAASAGGDAIVVTGYVTAPPVMIETDSATVDIPIVAEALEDIYAFEINMTYATDRVNVESIAMGDIFSDYGSAVVINDIDNDTGRVRYMQTILSADAGTDDGGTLCVIRITFEDGTYDAASDLGLTVKVADSTPAYLAAYTTPYTVTVDTQTDGDSSQPTPTTEPEPKAEPAPTATIGVVTPNPQSEQAETFIVAEEESTDEIIEAAAEYREESPQSTGSAISDAVEAAAEPMEPTVLPPDDTPYWIIWVAAVAVVIGVVVWLWVRKKHKMTVDEEQGEKSE